MGYHPIDYSWLSKHDIFVSMEALFLHICSMIFNELYLSTCMDLASETDN